jgi:hypothetical protein
MKKTFIKEILIPGSKTGDFGELLFTEGGIMRIPQKPPFCAKPRRLICIMWRCIAWGGLCTCQRDWEKVNRGSQQFHPYGRDATPKPIFTKFGILGSL